MWSVTDVPFGIRIQVGLPPEESGPLIGFR